MEPDRVTFTSEPGGSFNIDYARLRDMQEYFYSEYRQPSRREIARNIVRMKEVEKPEIMSFLKTGAITGNLRASMLPGGTILQVRGTQFQCSPGGQVTDIVFAIIDGTLIAYEKRVDRIRKELEAFAEKQGYAIEFKKNPLSSLYVCTQPVRLYRWSKREEVDDSKLLTGCVRPAMVDDVDSGEEPDDDSIEWNTFSPILTEQVPF